jgi:hypothetical protein
MATARRHGARLTAWTVVLCLGLAGHALAADATDDDEDDDEDEEEVVPAAPCARLAYEDGAADLPGGLRFERDGTCFVVGGEARLGHIWQRTKGQPGLAGPLSPGGAPIAVNRAWSFSTSMKVEAHRFTEAGRLGIVTELGWQTQEGDGLDRGLLQLRQAHVRIGGLRAGFGDSYATFASPAILAQGFAPRRAVGFAGYEASLGEATRLAVAVETGPVFGAAQNRFVPVDFGRKPYGIARLQHDFETGEVHLAGIVTERRLGLAGFRTRNVLGYAMTAGLRADLPKSLGGVNWGDHELSVQATYASNAVAYLGGGLDLGSLGAMLSGATEAKGYSGLASYTRRWTPDWSSTVFASGIRGEAPSLAGLRGTTLRYGANLVWQARPGLRIGVEVSRENVTVRTSPVLFGLVPATVSRANGTTVTAGVIAAF